MKEIAENVYIYTGNSLVTVGALRTSDGWVCIDSLPYPKEAGAWLDALHNIGDGPVRYLVNTDYHRDRIIGNQWFEAPIVAHQFAARNILALGDNFISQAAEVLSANKDEFVEMASLHLVPPQMSFSASLTLYAGDSAVDLVSRPGATAGSLWVILNDARVIFVGDTAITRQHPYIDSCASKNWLEILRILRQERYSDWTIVSGREGVVDIAQTEQLSEYLRVARRRVSGLLRTDGPRSEVSAFIPEMQEYFPIHNGRERTQRRIKAGLEAIYDEMRAIAEEAGEDEEE